MIANETATGDVGHRDALLGKHFADNYTPQIFRQIYATDQPHDSVDALWRIGRVFNSFFVQIRITHLFYPQNQRNVEACTHVTLETVQSFCLRVAEIAWTDREHFDKL